MYMTVVGGSSGGPIFTSYERYNILYLKINHFMNQSFKLYFCYYFPPQKITFITSFKINKQKNVCS